MSTQNPDTTPAPPKVTPPPKAKEPVFADPNDNVKAVEETTTFHKVGDKAQAKLHSIENNFVSLSSQRQLNLILGSLILISALTGGLGIFVSLILGTLMIVQAVTGNMILNDFIDTMDERHKKWFIPLLFGVLVFIVLAYLVIGFVGVGDS
jgi:hypothetical protein